jgi:tetratricopeptide (TPR) repeat protein
MAWNRRSDPEREKSTPVEEKGERGPRPSFVRRHVPAMALILLLGILAYSNAPTNTFHWDDIFGILDNPYVRGEEPAWRLFTSRTFFRVLGERERDIQTYRPITMLSYVLSYRLGGDSPGGYILFGIALHLLNAVLVYFSFGRLADLLTAGRPPGGSGDGRAVGLITALLFLLHPVNTESVNYIWARSTLLCGFFLLLSLALFLPCLQPDKGAQYARGKRGRWLFLAGSVAAYGAALLSKVIAAGFPAVLIFLPWILGERGRRACKKAVRYSLPFFLLLSAYLVFRVFFYGELAKPIASQSRGSYLLTQMRVLPRYAKLVLFPVNLNVFHHVKVPETLWDPAVLTGILGLGIVAAVVLFTPEHRAYRWCFLWIAAFLAPSSTIVPLNMKMNERRLYLPVIALCFGMALLAVQAAKAWRGRERFRIHRTAQVAGMTVILCFGLLSFHRNGIWRSEVALWGDCVAKSPDFALARNNYGYALMGTGRYAPAETQFRRAAEIDPDLFSPHHNLGCLYERKGRLDEALEAYRRGIRIEPDNVECLSNTANIYFRKGDLEEARAHYLRALRLNPSYFPALYNLGVLYQKAGRGGEALKAYRIALRVRPDSPSVHLNLGILLEGRSELEEALCHLRAYLRLEGEASPRRKRVEDLVSAIEDRRKREKSP